MTSSGEVELKVKTGEIRSTLRFLTTAVFRFQAEMAHTRAAGQARQKFPFGHGLLRSRISIIVV
jgi:hypothetical protein